MRLIDSGDPALAPLVLGAFYLSALVVGLVLGVPAASDAALSARGGSRIGIALLVLGAVAVLTVDYVVVVVPSVWETNGRCLFPGALFDGRCEIGPL